MQPAEREVPILGVGVSIALLTQIEGEVWARAGDDAHVNATGYQARARAIAERVEKC